jgi:hypothetical protein
LGAASPIALFGAADQPAAKSCSGLVDARRALERQLDVKSSELRDKPFSRPPVVWVYAVSIILRGVACLSWSIFASIAALPG